MPARERGRRAGRATNGAPRRPTSAALCTEPIQPINQQSQPAERVGQGYIVLSPGVRSLRPILSDEVPPAARLTRQRRDNEVRARDADLVEQVRQEANHLDLPRPPRPETKSASEAEQTRCDILTHVMQTVLPRPISSPRMPPTPQRKRFTSQRTPSR